MSQVVQLFSSISALPDAEIDLARAALEIGKIEYPELDVDRHLRIIDALAARVPRASTPLARLDRLNHFLFDVEHFRGNAADYYDPRNCFLSDVIERRLGIPITLSVLYIEVGRRIGLDLQGVNMPGHFLVKLVEPNGELLIDVFEHGRLLALEDCARKLRQIFGAVARLEPYMLQPAIKKQILARILGNLRNMYVGKRKFKKVVPVLDLHLALFPEDSEALKQRACALAELNDYRAALVEMERRKQPGDIEEILQQLERATGGRRAN